MPTQMQYYNSSPSVTGVLQPQTAPTAFGQSRPRDVYPSATVPRIRPATGFQFRDVSAPRGKPTWNDGRKSGEWTNSLRRYKVSLNHRPVESALSRRAPFAARTLSANPSGYRYRNGHMDTLPVYSSMNDPHLYDFYAKRFGLQVNPQPPSVRRTKGAQSKRSVLRSGSLAAKKVLYKVVVKTGDKKQSGTDARVFCR
ncbi:hypothetical protein GDO86_002571 [Hymenochirus boettgeri]|uniref:PLAT domain-containing protein n=1 Tax=Hymenochirus boettgeri TaxID=247094 RepID=A0A8T2KLD6_9PIPI|nr:hypothetical protein GDO86_002571 [Hymenochirus boettgeri]